MQQPDFDMHQGAVVYGQVSLHVEEICLLLSMTACLSVCNSKNVLNAPSVKTDLQQHEQGRMAAFGSRVA